MRNKKRKSSRCSLFDAKFTVSILFCIVSLRSEEESQKRNSIEGFSAGGERSDTFLYYSTTIKKSRASRILGFRPIFREPYEITLNKC